MQAETLAKTDEIADKLRAAVDGDFNDQVTFLARMVRFRSLRGQEASLQNWMAERLAERGYKVDTFSLADV